MRELVEFGEALRKEREQRAISLELVSDRTRVPRETFASLEAGMLDDLPARVYLRGFVRSYARELGMDGEAWRRRFDEALEAVLAESESTVEVSEVTEPEPESVANRMLDSLLSPGRPMLRGVAIGLAALVLLVLATVTLQSGSSEARNEVPVKTGAP